MKHACLPMIVVFLWSPLALAGKNPADYPLKVHILRQEWASHNAYRGMYRATGRGNIWDGGSIHAFDFKYECSFGIRRTPRNQGYPARWKKPSHRLTLLVAQIGEDDKYRECQLETTVRDGVYVLNPTGMTEMSQEAFKDWKSRREEARAQSRSDPGDLAATAKLSINSIPADAEIEVDGEFMGNTPSVLMLEIGEHTIVVRSAGHARWEKTLRLVPGEVKLSAELQPESAQGRDARKP